MLRLEKIPMELLILLAEKKGQLVSREEIAEKLWGKDVFLDTEQGINTAIRKIRQALRDDPEQSLYIQTVVGKGYRFIGPIKVTAKGGDGIAGQTASIQEKATFPIPLDRSRPLPVGVIVVAALALGSLIAFALLIGRVRQQRVEPLTLSAAPFTTYEGTETIPRLSPDGSQVAFSWDGDPPPGLKGFDLYVKVIGGENLLRLTRRPSKEWIGSAWSPDHTQIAFHRISGSDTGVYVVPALGGPERKLRSTRMSFVGSPIDWSPDGKWIVFQDILPPDNLPRLFLLSPETLEGRQIPHAPECLVEASPAFSHDGKHLAYTCIQDIEHHHLRIYTLAVSDRLPKPITTLGDIGWWGPLMGLAWTADDKRLIFPGEFLQDERGTITN